MNEGFRRQVALLISILPLIYKIKDFAVHGGTAINLFVKNMPRYSVDIDLTYLPLRNREESFQAINDNLTTIKQQLEKAIPGIRITHNRAILKMLCTKDNATVKIEVNAIKRGIIGQIEEHELCKDAQREFNMSCRARIVPFSFLYGGKIAAALSRQHPRDLFDYKYMEIKSFDQIKDGLIFYLLGSDKPLVELLDPSLLNQKQTLENQFRGMTKTTFEYEDFEASRNDLIINVKNNITEDDKEFLISYERGIPDWDKCCIGDISDFPSIKWKLKNINILKNTNYAKYSKGVGKLESFLSSWE